MKHFAPTAVAIIGLTAAPLMHLPFALAQTPSDPTASMPTVSPTSFDSASTASSTGTFIKKRYSIKGQWDIGQRNGQTVISFSNNFKTKSGPDLKVYLSPLSMKDVSSDTAAKQGVKLSVLKSNRGEQVYIVPETIDFTQFKSVLVHCEAYSVLWGGFDIPAP